MAKTQFVHVISLEKYLSSYKDRAYSWVKFYCRDTYDQKNAVTYRSILDDPAIEALDEVNRYRFFSLVLRETYLGRPVPMDEKNLAAMGWNLEICDKSKTLHMLHRLVEVCYTAVATSVPQRSEAKRTEQNISEAGGNVNGKPPDGSLADWLAPDFPLRFASALRLLIVPHTSGDQTIQENVGQWVQDQIRKGAEPKVIEHAVVERAERARRGKKPMALFQNLLQDELGYPRS